MSGKAILIPGCNFQGSTLGTVTIQQGSGGQEIALQSISIEQSGSYTGRNLVMSVTYQPFNTTQIGVTWSIVSGNSYASITTNGVLTINSTANASQVIVQATSTVNSTITATTTLTLTYDADAKYNVTWMLDENTTCSSNDTQINADDTLTFTLSGTGGNDTIGDFKIIMGGVNISKQCTLTLSNNLSMHRKSFNITTPPVTGDLIITNECHRIYQFKADTAYMGRVKNTASSGSAVWKTANSERFLHYSGNNAANGIIPAVKGDVIKYYFMPTNDTAYSETYDSDGQTKYRYIWTPKVWELNDSTIWSTMNKASAVDISNYITAYSGNIGGGHPYPYNAIGISNSYTLQEDNTVGIFIEISMWDYVGGVAPKFSNNQTFTAKFSLATKSELGLVFDDVQNITGGTVYSAITINETILEGGYFEAYNYGVTELDLPLPQ